MRICDVQPSETSDLGTRAKAALERVDTLALVRQLGAWRSVLVGVKQWRLLAGQR